MRLSSFSASASLAALVLLSSCSPSPRAAALSAAGPLAPRLAAILEACPLPEGWTLSDDHPSAIISLEPAADRPPGPSLSAAAGALWEAPALPLADPRFSVSPGEAETIGLEALDSILPPRRAVAVDGRWPGEEGYPFERALELRVRAAPSGRPAGALAAWLRAAAAAALGRDRRPAVLCAAGDMQAGAAEAPALAAGGSRVEELFRDGLADRLRRADFLVGNLEGVVSAKGSPNPRKRFLFRMPPGTARSLMAAGFDLVLLANNHVFDFGPEAFEDTLRELDEASLPQVGAGRDAAAATALRQVPTPAGDLAFIGFASYPRERLGFTVEEAAAGPSSPGINADEEATVASIAAATASGQAVVVLAHGGAEYVSWTPGYLRERYRRFADAGAALVIGSHPHVLQGVEARGRSLIAYSLGNFLFTGLEEPPESRRSAALEFLVYRGAARGLRLEPVVVGMRSTSPDPDRASAERRFAALCAGLAGE